MEEKLVAVTVHATVKGKPFVVSVAFSFEHLKACEKCGAYPLKVISDRTSTQDVGKEEHIVRLVYYECPAGHQSQLRKVIQKRFPWRN